MADLVDFADGYESVGKRLLGRTIVVDELQRAIKLHDQGVRDRLVLSAFGAGFTSGSVYLRWAIA